MKNNWEVHVQENFGGWNVRIWLIEKSYKPSVARIEGTLIKLVELKEGVEEPEPTLVLNRDAWMALKSALIDTQERDKHTVEAELGATKYHLEDMRKLVLKANNLLPKKDTQGE